MQYDRVHQPVLYTPAIPKVIYPEPVYASIPCGHLRCQSLLKPCFDDSVSINTMLAS